MVRTPVALDKKILSIELHCDILQAVPCTGWNNCSYSKQPLSKIDVLLLMSLSRLDPGLKLSLEQNSAHKNLLMSAYFCWDSRRSLRQVDQKNIFRGTIGYGDSYLKFLFPQFKVFTLHALLYDAAGSVRAHSGKGPG